ncbi:MAG: hypothetical protein PVH61_00535 [Candidatus Aminicenantes bacterium]|jgi:hypothetical protein
MIQRHEHSGSNIVISGSSGLPFAFIDTKQICLKNLHQCKEELETLVVEIVNKKKSEEALNRTKVRGSPFKNQLLTPGILKQNKLEPKYRMTTKGIERALFSSAYNIGQGRIAVAAYIKKEKNYITASYYLSNSHGIWRCLDGYFMVENKIISYGTKGRQDSMNLALVFQKALSEITENGTPIINIHPCQSDFIFTGTTYNALLQINSRYLKSKTQQKNGPDLPQKLSGNFYAGRGKRIPPEAIKFYNHHQAPDFSKLITRWEAANKIYGKIVYEAFLSGNSQFIYTFCQDEKNRTWLASIENHSPIQPTGVREIWVDGGDLTTPAYEYDIKAGVYGNAQLRWGNYIDMSKNYLSKIWKTVN